MTGGLERGKTQRREFQEKERERKIEGKRDSEKGD